MSHSPSKEINCETQGHLWGALGVCVMCKTPKSEQPSSNQLADEFERHVHEQGYVRLGAEKKRLLAQFADWLRASAEPKASKTGVARWDFRRLARVAIDSLPVPSCERMAKELDKIFSLLDHAPDVPAVIEEECSWCKGVGKIGMPGATCNFCSGEGVRRRDVLPVEPRTTPVAWVPVHPKNGPLWASTIASKEADHPEHYPLMPLYTSEPPSDDADPNAPWLSIAHSLCSDLGIAQGRIYDRMLALSEEIRRPRSCQRASVPPSDARWVRCETSDVPLNTPVIMRRTGSPQIPMWEWIPVTKEVSPYQTLACNHNVFDKTTTIVQKAKDGIAVYECTQCTWGKPLSGEAHGTNGDRGE